MYYSSILPRVDLFHGDATMPLELVRLVLLDGQQAVAKVDPVVGIHRKRDDTS